VFHIQADAGGDGRTQKTFDVGTLAQAGLYIDELRCKRSTVPPTRLQVLGECRPSGRARRPIDVRARAPLFKALGDATRLEMVALIAQALEPLCACELEAHFDLAQPTISHHLKILRKAGVLTSERRGTWIYYGLDPALREQLLDFAGVLGK
jgi:ArsR family transcriptional regulator